jgi:hypothetical protein
MKRSDARKVRGTAVLEDRTRPAALDRNLMLAVPPAALRGVLDSGTLARSGRLAVRTAPVDGLVLIDVILVVFVMVVVTVVLHEAEVDRHLAHRAGHLPSDVLCCCSPATPRVTCAVDGRSRLVGVTSTASTADAPRTP